MAILRMTAVVTLLASAIAVSTARVDQTENKRSTQDLDRSIKPGDDFYHYANGGWLKTVSIPAGQSSYDTRAILVARTGQRVRDLIQDAAAAKFAKGSVSQKVGDYYASFVDEASIAARGMAPLADEMSLISAITDKVSLSSYLGTTLNTEVDGLTGNADHVFGVWVNQSFTDSEHYVFHFWQGGLGTARP